MNLSLLGWAVALGASIHNLEEALLFPAYATRFGRWYASISAQAFGVAASILSVLGLLAAVLASLGGAHSAGAYLITAYALAMALNAIIPHLAACVVFRAYIPGAASGLLLTLPLGAWFVYRALTEDYVAPASFAFVGPAVVLGMLTSIPLLLGVGKWLTRHAASGRNQA